MNLFRFFSIFFIFICIHTQAQSNLSPTITIDEFIEQYQNVKVIAVCSEEDFNQEAIYGAKQISRSDFSSSDYAYGGMRADREKVELLLGSLGILASDTIVIYDHKGGCDAARFWWILDLYGHKNTQLLDGGITAWKEKNVQLSPYSIKEDTTIYRFNNPKNKAKIATLKEVYNALYDDQTIIIDTRTLNEFEGAIQKEGAYRAGRIPGAIHIDWAQAINYDGNKLIKSNQSLLQLYQNKGIAQDKNVIFYCQSGVRSAHSTFILSQMLQFPNVKNYDGSWIEWSYNDSLPIETGPEEMLAQNEMPETELAYSEIFFKSFRDFGNYTWREITFQVEPWYVNYFWWLIVLSLAVWVLEIVFPWRKNQALIRKDFWMDAFFMFFNFYIFKLIIFMAFSNVTEKAFTDLFGGDLSRLAIFDLSGQALWVQLLIFFVATDFIQWFTHVLLHRYNIFWRFHKVHHSVEQMGFAAHLRYHWMENVFYTPMKFIAVMLLGGFTPEMAFIVFYFAIAIGHFNHANIGLSYGPLKYIINNPKMHIWHHAKELPENHKHGANFGISLSLWDYIFKTNYIPSSGRDIELGFDGMEKYPKSFWGLLISGFKRNKK